MELPAPGFRHHWGTLITFIIYQPEEEAEIVYSKVGPLPLLLVSLEGDWRVVDLKTLGYSCEGIHGIWERESCGKKGILGPQVHCEPAFWCICQKKKMPEISGHVNGIIVWKQENDGPSLPPVDRTHQPSHLRGNMLASTPQVHNFGFQIYHSRVPKYSNEDSWTISNISKVLLGPSFFVLS